ncbi:hypothetical protein M2S00_06690 [Apilactobacillus sp. TMW 2.2459]|uniref:hypothetical protein n=1 Tax=Apilactobacillus xinyiensis TaxID=2841032 RepID=UPI00200CBEB0|nr:hypothetical protein [Apilactobacillus xinyiensis]MCL0312791.1 hypothetical protein [Apilactobacillus xinyiensis]
MIFDDMQSLIDDFTVGTVTVVNHKSTGHKNRAGIWVKGPDVKNTFEEPIIPNDTQEKFDYSTGGQVQLFDASWYSKHSEFSIGDEVTDDTTQVKYQIANKTNYDGYAGVTIYALKAVTR